MNDLLISIIRIGISAAVSLIVVRLGEWGVDVDGEGLIRTVTAGAVVVVYAALGALERRYPQLRILGFRKPTPDQ